MAPGGTRTHNLRLRRATPCPLGHESYEYRHRTAPSRRRPPPVVVAVPRVVAPPRRRRRPRRPKFGSQPDAFRVVAVAAGRAARAPALHKVEAHLVVARPRRVISVRGDAARDVLGAHLPALLVENLRSMRGDRLRRATLGVLGGTRTRNLLLRRETPCPLGHESKKSKGLPAGLEPAIFALGGRRLIH